MSITACGCTYTSPNMPPVNNCAVPGDPYLATMNNACVWYEDANIVNILNQYCESIPGGEWTSPPGSSNNPGPSCTALIYTGGYADATGSTCAISSDPQCSLVAGNRVTCQRTIFNANKAQCCVQDNAYFPSNSCFVITDGIQLTCDPGYLDATSTNCQDALLSYCSGEGVTDRSWYSRWIGPSATCPGVLKRKLFIYNTDNNKNFNPDDIQPLPSSIPNICNYLYAYPFDAQGYYWAQQLMNQVMIKYQQDDYIIGSEPGEATYNPFQDYMYSNICCPFSGVCETALKTACASRTAQRISLFPEMTKWCGCHLPLPEYQLYSEAYNIPPECSPTCNRSLVIPITGPGAEISLCDRNVCIMNNITANLVNTTVGSSVDIDQVCGGCVNGGCYCAISDNIIDINNSTIGGKVIPVSQMCGTLSCNTPNTSDVGPSLISSPCNSIPDMTPFWDRLTGLGSKNALLSLIITVVIIAVIIGVVILISWLVMRYARRDIKKT